MVAGQWTRGRITTDTGHYNARIRRLALFLASALAGAVLALSAMPWFVRNAHDDASRLCAILDACRSGATPRIAVFGNSVSMFAIDARQLSGELPSRPLAWNLGSPAQTLTEALLLTQELPSSVQTVIQIVTPPQLEHRYPIEPGRYDALVICGYAPREATRAAVARAFGDVASEELALGPLGARIHGRHHVRAWLEGVSRALLRRDSARARLTHDLFFPAADGPRGGWRPEQLFAHLDRDHRFVRNPQQDAILAEAASYARKSGRRYVVVLAPVHPILSAERDAISCPPGLECLDLRTSLRADEFRDPTHPTLPGARRTTAAVARFLGRPIATR